MNNKIPPQLKKFHAELRLMGVDISSAKYFQEIVEDNKIRTINLTNVLGDGQNIPSTLFNLNYLKYLNLSENSLKQVPDEICSLQNLMELNLSRNDLSRIPTCIGKLDNLQELNLSHNSLPNVPESLQNCSGLQKLNLSHNELDHIPNEIYGLKNLQELNLSDNEIEKLEPEIFQISSLKKLVIKSNNLKSLTTPKDPHTQLYYIDLSDNSLTELGKVELPRSVRYLNIRENALKSVDILVDNLQELMVLFAGNNELSSIPKFLSDYGRLEALDIRYNRIDQIPLRLKNSNIRKLFYDKDKIQPKDTELQEWLTSVDFNHQYNNYVIVM